MSRRSLLIHSGTFLAGAATVAVALSVAWALSLDVLIDGIVAEHLFHQELLAQRAEREDDHLAEIVHRMNVAYLNEERGLAWVSRWKAGDLLDRAQTPMFALSALSDRSFADPEKLALGQQLVAALAHARAALVLERAGLEEFAIDEWERADELHPTKGAEWLREVAECCPSGNSEVDLAMEGAVLDSGSNEELTERLAQLRAEHYGEALR
jgi:hypothetical protein